MTERDPAYGPLMGEWRVYFNRHNPDDKPWCVSPPGGSWEIAVRRVRVEVPSDTVYSPKTAPDDEDGKPSAWIAAIGLLSVSASGEASIEPPSCARSA